MWSMYIFIEEDGIWTFWIFVEIKFVFKFKTKDISVLTQFECFFGSKMMNCVGACSMWVVWFDLVFHCLDNGFVCYSKVSLSLSLSFFLSLSLCRCLSVAVSLLLSVCLCLSFCLSVCLSVCLSLSLSLSLCLKRCWKQPLNTLQVLYFKFLTKVKP